MTSQVDLARHTQIRSRLRSTLDELKASGVTVRQLIEATRDELQILHIADEASAKDLHRPGADSSSRDPSKRIVRNKTHHVTTARINAQAAGVNGILRPTCDNTSHP